MGGVFLLAQKAPATTSTSTAASVVVLVPRLMVAPATTPPGPPSADPVAPLQSPPANLFHTSWMEAAFHPRNKSTGWIGWASELIIGFWLLVTGRPETGRAGRKIATTRMMRRYTCSTA